MDLQRIDLKALVDAPRDVNLDPLLAIFSRWRNDKDHPARWVDLADYAHMSRGAGIVIVGKQGIFGMTRFEPALGLLYSGRADYEGSFEKRVLESFRRHLALTTALLREPDYPAELKTLTGGWEVTVNDRLGFPNNDDTDKLLRPQIVAALDKVFGAAAYEITRLSDPQQRYGFGLRSDKADSEQLLAAAQNGL